MTIYIIVGIFFMILEFLKFFYINWFENYVNTRESLEMENFKNQDGRTRAIYLVFMIVDYIYWAYVALGLFYSELTVFFALILLLAFIKRDNKPWMLIDAGLTILIYIAMIWYWGFKNEFWGLNFLL